MVADALSRKVKVTRLVIKEWELLECICEWNPKPTLGRLTFGSTCFWYNQWLPLRPLYQKFTRNILTCFGLTKDDKVAKYFEMIAGNGLKVGNYQLIC